MDPKWLFSPDPNSPADSEYCISFNPVQSITNLVYKQVNFGLQNCKLTKKADDFVSKPPAL